MPNITYNYFLSLSLGGPAETSGLIPHDLIVSINGQDVSGYNHFNLISLIKQSSAKGFVTMGVVRRPSLAGMYCVGVVMYYMFYYM